MSSINRNVSFIFKRALCDYFKYYLFGIILCGASEVESNISLLSFNKINPRPREMREDE
jgi:hypothetical protein